MTRTHVYDPHRINDGTTHGRCRTVRASMDHCGEDIRPFLPEVTARRAATTRAFAAKVNAYRPGSIVDERGQEVR